MGQSGFSRNEGGASIGLGEVRTSDRANGATLMESFGLRRDFSWEDMVIKVERCRMMPPEPQVVSC
jgi:hypothetical protein